MNTPAPPAAVQPVWTAYAPGLCNDTPCPCWRRKIVMHAPRLPAGFNESIADDSAAGIGIRIETRPHRLYVVNRLQYTEFLNSYGENANISLLHVPVFLPDYDALHRFLARHQTKSE